MKALGLIPQSWTLRRIEDWRCGSSDEEPGGTDLETTRNTSTMGEWAMVSFLGGRLNGQYA